MYLNEIKEIEEELTQLGLTLIWDVFKLLCRVPTIHQ